MIIYLRFLSSWLVDESCLFLFFFCSLSICINLWFLHFFSTRSSHIRTHQSFFFIISFARIDKKRQFSFARGKKMKWNKKKRGVQRSHARERERENYFFFVFCFPMDSFFLFNGKKARCRDSINSCTNLLSMLDLNSVGSISGDNTCIFFLKTNGKHIHTNPKNETKAKNKLFFFMNFNVFCIYAINNIIVTVIYSALASL